VDKDLKHFKLIAKSFLDNANSKPLIRINIGAVLDNQAWLIKMGLYCLSYLPLFNTCKTALTRPVVKVWSCV